MKRLLIAVAINAELKILRNFIHNIKPLKSKDPMFTGTISGYPVDVLVTSMGLEAAGNAAARAIDFDRHGGVLVLGYCGGLCNTLKVTDVVIASRVTSPLDSKTFQLDSRVNAKLGKGLIQEGLRYRSAPFLSQNQVIQTQKERQKLFEATHAEAVDMETSEITRQAFGKSVKAAAVKILIDDTDSEMPDFNEAFHKSGKMDHISVKQTFLSQPALSIRFSKNVKLASQVLKKVVPLAVPIVCQQWEIRSH